MNEFVNQYEKALNMRDVYMDIKEQSLSSHFTKP